MHPIGTGYLELLPNRSPRFGIGQPRQQPLRSAFMGPVRQQTGHERGSRQVGIGVKRYFQTIAPSTFDPGQVVIGLASACVEGRMKMRQVQRKFGPGADLDDLFHGRFHCRAVVSHVRSKVPAMCGNDLTECDQFLYVRVTARRIC